MPYKEFDVDGIGTVKIYKRRNSRRLRLTVPAKGIVHVTMPMWAPYRAGLSFTLSRRDWILSQIPQRSALLANGQIIGKSHRLVFRPQDATGIKTSVRAAEVVVSFDHRYTVTDRSVQTAAEAACWRALRKQAARLFTVRVHELAERHGFQYGKVTIKRMKSRWGSCDVEGNINLNLFLVQLPWDLIDYVILHELTHTVVLNHSSDFWRRLEAALPDARQRRRAIKAYQPTLLVAPE